MSAITENSVYISVDFGSSETAVAWLKADGEIIRPIRNWKDAKNTPFGAGSELDEVPTIVATKAGDYRFGYGCQNLASNLRSSWKILRDLKASIHSRKNQDALVQYLEFIRTHAFEQIKKELPAFDLVEFVVTCPANFGSGDQQYLTTCLRLAGWPTEKLKIFIWEVEAAMASYAKEHQDQLLGKVTTFLFIDAGGGTCVS